MFAGSAEPTAVKCVRLFHSAQQQEKRKSTYNMQSNLRLWRRGRRFQRTEFRIKAEIVDKYIVCDRKQNPCRSKKHEPLNTAVSRAWLQHSYFIASPSYQRVSQLEQSFTLMPFTCMKKWVEPSIFVFTQDVCHLCMTVDFISKGCTDEYLYMLNCRGLTAETTSKIKKKKKS